VTATLHSEHASQAGPGLTGPARRRPRKRWRDRPAVIAATFLLPGVAALAVLRIVPTIDAVVNSLYHSSVLLHTTRFVGLGNFRELFADPTFRQSALVTLLFNVIINPLQIAVALTLAVLFNQQRAHARWMRTLVFLPVAVPPIASAVVWGVAFQPNGIANALLHVIGLPSQPFLTSSSQALGCIIVMLSWIGVGYWMMFLIAGLQDVPPQLLEAAQLDGAGPWRSFWRVTFPLLRRPLAFVLVADTVANFLVFAPMQVLTNGGPNGSTNVTMLDIFTRAYSNGNLHQADAEVVLLAVITLAVVAVQFRLLRAQDTA
jgi:multiple sugar transport system permease protein